MNPILLGILCFTAGLLIGMVVLLFIMGATKTNHEHEIYMEGYNAGFISGKCEGIDEAIDIINSKTDAAIDIIKGKSKGGLEDGRCKEV